MKKTCCYSANEIVTKARRQTAQAINAFLNADKFERSVYYNYASSLLCLLLTIDAIGVKQWLRITDNLSSIRFG